MRDIEDTLFEIKRTLRQLNKIKKEELPIVELEEVTDHLDDIIADHQYESSFQYIKKEVKFTYV